MPTIQYPLLERVTELYENAGLEDVLLLASQHLLEPQEAMFNALLRHGLKPSNGIIVGKNYSTNPDVMHRLESAGFGVAPFSFEFDPMSGFASWFPNKLRDFMDEILPSRKLSDYRKVIVLDDGGYLHCAVNSHWRDAKNVFGIEQTSSGHRMISCSRVRFPWISVARSYHKLTYESPYIGQCGCERIVRHLKQRGKTKPNILVFGLGAIGKQVASRLFLKDGYDGYAMDFELPNVANQKAVKLLEHHGRVLGWQEAMDRLAEFDVLVGTTGSRLFDERDVKRFHPKVSLISMSSGDHEFPSWAFRHEDGGIHDDYYRDGRCSVNAGFPITFDGKPNAMPPQQIELTMALLLIRIMDEVSDHAQELPYTLEAIRCIWDPDTGADGWYERNL